MIIDLMAQKDVKNKTFEILLVGKYVEDEGATINLLDNPYTPLSDRLKTLNDLVNKELSNPEQKNES